LIDYISDDQFEELEVLKYDADKELQEITRVSLESSELRKQLDERKDHKKQKKYEQLITEFDYKVRNPKLLKYFRAYVACSVKDWKNIKDVKTDKDIKCEIEENRLNKSSLRLLTENPYNTLFLFNLISSETEFNSVDKKKFNTANS
jgi:ADP-ribose pyrophosphatase YjhB (NUDIX family)